MANDFLFPGGILSLPKTAASRLLEAAAPDATHLYLALLAEKSVEALHWSPERLQQAQAILVDLSLLAPEESLKGAPAEKPEPEQPPEYTARDVSLALENDGEFPALVEELQRRLGKLLSPSDLNTLLLLYDYLSLPAEVILLLTSAVTEEIKKKFGQGRRPTLTQIKTEAFRWQRNGVDTLEAAEDYLQKRTRFGEAANRLLPLLGIHGREAVAAERRYLEKWVEQGFQDDAIQLAYEKTVLKKQSMNWPYMNSILRSWHQKGFHSKQEVQEGEGYRKKAAQTAPLAATGDRAKQDMQRLDRLLEEGKS